MVAFCSFYLCYLFWNFDYSFTGILLMLIFIFAVKTGIGGGFVYVELSSGSVWRQS